MRKITLALAFRTLGGCSIVLTHAPCPEHRRNNTPRPDPILLEGGPDDGAQVELLWGYPPGVPTPDPALLCLAAKSQAGVGELATPRVWLDALLLHGR